MFDSDTGYLLFLISSVKKGVVMVSVLASSAVDSSSCWVKPNTIKLILAVSSLNKLHLGVTAKSC